jgi:hypothetical protein
VLVHLVDDQAYFLEVKFDFVVCICELKHCFLDIRHTILVLQLKLIDNLVDFIARGSGRRMVAWHKAL